MYEASHAEHEVDVRCVLEWDTEWNAQSIRCTKEGSVSCQLLQHRPEFNKVLVDAALELREDRRGKSRGNVLIAVVEAITCGYVWRGFWEDSGKARALDLVEHLLAAHRCITAMEFNPNLMLRPSLLSAVKRQPSLTSVTVSRTVFDSCDAAEALEVIKCISQLKNLAFKVYDVEKRWVTGTNRIPFDLGMNYLSTLHVADLLLDRCEAGRLVQALIENKSLADLSVGENVFCEDMFPRYLSAEKCRLRKLAIKSFTWSDDGSLLRKLVDAFCKMNFLEDLNVDIGLERTIFADTLILFANLVTRSATLRSLGLPWTICDCLARSMDPNIPLPDPKAAQCMQFLLTVLQKADSPLNQLFIDLRGFGEADCRAFFDAVADSDALRTVIVNYLPCVIELDRVFTRERGVNDRVVIKSHNMHYDTMQLLKCPQISSIAIRKSWSVRPDDVGYQAVISALQMVGGSSHVTSLRVRCGCFNRNEFSALAGCIRNASVLTDVDISLVGARVALTDEELTDVQAELVSALASNLKLAKIGIQDARLSDGDLNVLAGAASKSISLTAFTMTPPCGFTETIGRTGSCCVNGHCGTVSLNKGLSREFNFKDIALADILQATRRNASTVSAAAQLVLGHQDAFEGADAIELMHGHPRLLEMVMEGADVTKAEAQKMISSVLARVRHCSLHEFMMAAGVVKRRVECLRHPDARRQLADIDHDCWLHIRSYLKIVDVLNI
ncbi:hypothetical protein HPB49_022385 [Dermacentor silvarum]|uniref:Uncharacterized protein n=1 Tax=Dermacentor silvarum TaxID=543639 RepID=A0ACB8CTT5_DERSI|nr:uncharacterized protein LOC119452327 [Dermacentor silvarum]XP_049523456.1 uncharacterized protein LOC119452327 [Dermacentor silvarum]XP_049523458.1 uncharacterized protein LOC119452327 [Dermacentor silvarum]XP_049523459.1 uncharacterized protein LOC119452327 [Dermacentor silvarum]KAH7950318.1 hypothetical protein HPB49_022385 [Dermacentor silvarum]